jgi:hypothetical protein
MRRSFLCLFVAPVHPACRSSRSVLGVGEDGPAATTLVSLSSSSVDSVEMSFEPNLPQTSHPPPPAFVGAVGSPGVCTPPRLLSSGKRAHKVWCYKYLGRRTRVHEGTSSDMVLNHAQTTPYPGTMVPSSWSFDARPAVSLSVPLDCQTRKKKGGGGSLVVVSSWGNQLGELMMTEKIRSE